MSFAIDITSYIPDIPLGTDYYGVTCYSHPEEGVTHDQLHEQNGIYYGLKWQCVEFVRRWYIQTLNLTFNNIPAAADMTKLTHLTPLSHPTHITPLLDIRIEDAQPGALIIFKRNNDLPHGHVAIVCKRTKSRIYLSEQNYNTATWGKRQYSRILPPSQYHTILAIKQISD